MIWAVFCLYLLFSITIFFVFFFSSRRRHTRLVSDWSSDVCSSDLGWVGSLAGVRLAGPGERLHALKLKYRISQQSHNQPIYFSIIHTHLLTTSTFIYNLDLLFFCLASNPGSFYSLDTKIIILS